jgi:TPR repeat protein
MGIMREMGLGIPKDYSAASKWYQKAAIQGNAEAQKRLVEMKKKGRRNFSPPPIPKNFTGNMTEPEVQYDLGVMYYKGIGVKKDLQAASRWFEVAAHQGHPRAQNDLAVMLLKGIATGSPNSSKAYPWFLKAAEQGFADAQFNLGLMLSTGKGHGMPQHFTLAYMWFEIAARNNILEARNRQVRLTKKMTHEEILAAKEQARQWLSKHGLEE